MDGHAGMTKVHFRLEPDEDGFPPANVESLWASPSGNGTFRLENVPFFVVGVAYGDVVRARDVDGSLWFDGEVVNESGHGTIRVMLQDRSKEDSIKEFVRNCGCTMEQSHIPGYFAIDVPPSARAKELVEFLAAAEEAETLGYDEGVKTW